LEAGVLKWRAYADLTNTRAMNEPREDTSGSDGGIAGLDAVGATVKSRRDLGFVYIEFVDADGADFAVRLSGPSMTELIVDLVDALSELKGKLGAKGRMREAQLLLQALIEQRRRRARWVAQRLGVGDSAVSLWRHGKTAPTQARLDQLRELVKSTVRPD
jgi:hypothetical protein